MKIWEQLWKVFYKIVRIIEKYPWISLFLSTLQACKLRPNWKINFPAEIFKFFTRTFRSPSQWLLLNAAAQTQEEHWAWNRLFYGTLLSESMEIISMVKDLLFRKNNFVCSRKVNRFIINGYFWFFQGLTKIVVNQSLNDT